MIKFILILLPLFLFSSCSIDKASGLWTKNKLIEKEKNKDNKIILKEELFKEDDAFSKEINKDLLIKLSAKTH